MRKVARVIGLIAMLGTASAASATALLGIVAPDGSEEHTGDPGGSIYPWNGGHGPGAGVPWQARDDAGNIAGGWPTGAGMGPDPSFAPNWGTSGFNSSYLILQQDAWVTFQYMGAGNSTQRNRFWLDWNYDGDYDDPGELLFVDDNGDGTGSPPCAIAPAGATNPTCVPGVNEFSFHLRAGAIPFAYLTERGILLENDGTGLGNPSPYNDLPGYFVGCDPYQTTANHQRSCKHAAYVGLTDLPDPGDHDFQDMGVRIFVPEPGSLALLGLGLVGVGFARRRRD